MPFGLVYYPNLESDGLNAFRLHHDPTASLIEPHLGIMFLIPDSVGEAKIVGHLESILRRWRPFSIRIHGLAKSWD